jgi:ATP-dependent Clp protease protease subunit
LRCLLVDVHEMTEIAKFLLTHSYLYSHSPNSRIMLHQPSGGAQGMASDIDIQAREILRTRARLNNLYVHHTGQPLEEIERVMDRDFFMDPKQAMDFGVIDAILDKRAGHDEDEDEKAKSAATG